MRYFQIFSASIILCLLVTVAVNPQLAYAPAPRVILFLLASVFPALLIATTASTSLHLEAKGFVFTTAGASAFFLATMLILNYLAKPELQVVAFDVVDSEGEKVNLNPNYAFTVESNPNGLVANAFVKGGSVILIFPEQLAEQRISIRPASNSKSYTGVVNYARRPSEALKIGRDLK